MKVSRRRFLVVAGAGASGWLARPRAVLPSPRTTGAAYRPCALVDLAGASGLPESMAGYEAGLRAVPLRFHKSGVTGALLPAGCRAVIVPGCVTMAEDRARDLARQLESGALVVLESGAGFSTRKEFEAHRRWLERHWGVQAGAPRHLWSGVGDQGRVPYIDYAWPIRTKIRDFSRVVPIEPRGVDVIARVDEVAVACRRSVGRGTLVFLGSPLGPALQAGDAEAGEWLRQVLASG